MDYQNVLRFRGNWRSYQARVLENANQYLKDGKIHIVAAPGSGKTTLGIELIARLNQPALVLAPSITIREQWVSRIVEAFLCEGLKPEDYLSQDLKNPKVITVATYQSLHSAMTRFKGEVKEDTGEAEEETSQTEASIVSQDVDYSNFDLIQMAKDNGIGVLCLDECHHLRSEWWKALEEFKKGVENLQTIALTATPPYDSTPALWTRYMNMCGEIDEEITIPELVKEGSLCPHQDFVYFNYPTREETSQIQIFEEKSAEMMNQLMKDSTFISYVRSHGSLNGSITDEQLLEEPAYLAAILIFLQAQNLPFPSRLKKLLGASKLPDMEEKWMEILLQKFLYDDVDAFACDNVYREQLIAKMKQHGLIEKRKVAMTANTKIEKLLTTSKGKCESIREIVTQEYESMGNGLRLLILTDYIRREYEKSLGNPENDVTALGVLPFFEQLRRAQIGNLRLGVLCGSIVIIPAEAKQALEETVGTSGKITFQPVGNIEETDYVKVTAVSDAHFLTAAVTEIFSQGYMQVLIGTKSLLGEGWDSPCINSLILASFVGSFMLSNQMRGRAIRVWKENPQKTSNIWHLVCLRPWKEVQKDQSGAISEDFTLLSRRMEHFLGLHYTEDTIENGMDRLSIIKPPFSKLNVAHMNRDMLALSKERTSLKARWERSLAILDKMEVVDETNVEDRMVTAAVFWDAIRSMVLSILLSVFMYAGSIGIGVGAPAGILGAAAFVALLFAIVKLPKALMLGSPMKRLKAYGMGIRKALLGAGLLESENSKVVALSPTPMDHAIYLAGGSGRDKALFAQCVLEFFSEVDNQRYLLVKHGFHKGSTGFYCVPDAFAKKKEDAQMFLDCMKPYIGKYDLVYTRNTSGRELLLEGRVYALANRQNRLISKKKVKGALE